MGALLSAMNSMGWKLRHGPLLPPSPLPWRSRCSRVAGSTAGSEGDSSSGTIERPASETIHPTPLSNDRRQSVEILDVEAQGT